MLLGFAVSKHLQPPPPPPLPQLPPPAEQSTKKSAPPSDTAIIIVKPMPTDRYTSIGYLANDAGTNLPLFARPSLTSRDRFNYYVMSNDQQPVRLVVMHNGQNCASEQGCSEIFDNDQLSITEYGGKIFRVKLYPKETVSYDPRVGF
jgi:hypothetical protein